MEEKVVHTDFPRVTLKCKCGNEFIINVTRLRDHKKVMCQICGQEFVDELGEKFANALQDLYKVKYQLEKDNYPFHFSFVYKSSYTQPPMPYSFNQE